MPIYEFFSPNTKKIYSFYAKSVKYSSDIPFCPDGKDNLMIKLFSAFSITGPPSTESNISGEDAGSSESDPFSNLSSRQSAVIMNELESAYAGMDGDNPDPRQMGGLMRRICELSGEKISGNMEEVVRKLEEGTDPEVLEDRLGDFAESNDPELNLDNHENTCNSSSKIKIYPIKDSNLYDIEDYLS